MLPQFRKIEADDIYLNILLLLLFDVEDPFCI